MRRATKSVLALGVLAAALAPAPQASAADYSGHVRHSRSHADASYSQYGYSHGVRGPTATMRRDYSGVLPACSDERVLGHIASRFSTRERGYWASDLELTGFTPPRELGYRSWGDEFIPRRFCAATTVTSDGRRRQVFYEIGEGFGFAGVGWDVNWCVTGLDRSYAYAPGCKMARP